MLKLTTVFLSPAFEKKGEKKSFCNSVAAADVRVQALFVLADSTKPRAPVRDNGYHLFINPGFHPPAHSAV